MGNSGWDSSAMMQGDCCFKKKLDFVTGWKSWHFSLITRTGKTSKYRINAIYKLLSIDSKPVSWDDLNLNTKLRNRLSPFHYIQISWIHFPLSRVAVLVIFKISILQQHGRRNQQHLTLPTPKLLREFHDIVIIGGKQLLDQSPKCLCDFPVRFLSLDRDIKSRLDAVTNTAESLQTT